MRGDRTNEGRDGLFSPLVPAAGGGPALVVHHNHEDNWNVTRHVKAGTIDPELTATLSETREAEVRMS